MGERHEEIFHQKGYIHNKYAHENMLKSLATRGM